jgi:uncharacterized protein with HEPN domain
MKDDRLYLTHILECIERVETYTAEGKRSFFEDIKTQDATMRNLQTMAESTQRLSDAAKASHPEIDWRRIAGFRNIVVHGYLSLDYDKAWNVVENELSPLKGVAQELLHERESPGSRTANSDNADA